MDIRHSINLLTAAIFAIFCLLGAVTCQALNSSVAAEEAAEVVAWCGTPDVPNDQYAAGKKVWNQNGCGACHAKSMATDAAGPALGGVVERWANYPRTDLYAWIRNNGKLRAAGHPRALDIYNEWNGAAMNTYPNLKNEDIENLLAYIEEQYH